MYPTNKQEIFNEVYTKLVKQGAPSIENGVCRYRGPNNTRCAVGWLIPDEEYQETFEAKGVVTVAREEIEEGPLRKFLWENQEFLEELQKAHDSLLEYGYSDYPADLKPESWLEKWKGAMSGIAKMHNLTIPNVQL